MRLILINILLGILLLCNLPTVGQSFLLVENFRTLKNFKYYEGDLIRIKTFDGERIVEGEITCINDSSICVGDWTEVYLDDIQMIYRERFGILLSRRIFLYAGMGYFAVDVFNRLINNDAPVILEETVYISAGLVGMNFLLIPLKYKRIKTGNWKVEFINPDQFDVYPVKAL
jgi:hypothetical protein